MFYPKMIERREAVVTRLAPTKASSGVFQAKLDGTSAVKLASQKDCLFITGDVKASLLNELWLVF
jgi:hypothetical protein